ncbi:MAG TPA: hypothetical protein VFX16_21135 [Pseudonocardiaceae bacterium]|nr:hypothetical protein [Pseudonocardiaceae bacterium]
MATMVLTSTAVTVNAVDYSDHVQKAELALEVDAQDTTNFASLGWKESQGGLKSGTLSITFLNDYAASAVDANLWALFGTVTTFAVKPTSDDPSATNPEYSGSVLVDKYTPLTGAPGDMALAEVQWTLSGAVSRATA